MTRARRVVDVILLVAIVACVALVLVELATHLGAELSGMAGTLVFCLHSRPISA